MSSPNAVKSLNLLRIKMSQRQDLTFFQDNYIIPHTSITKEHLLGLITHVQGTSASWLTNILIENSLYGTCIINHDKKQNKTPLADVFLISFLQGYSFYEKDLKKNGVEINDNKNFHFIDLFTDLFTKVSTSESITKTFDGIATQIMASQSITKIVIIEGIEFLLSATTISPISLLKQINKLHKQASSLLIISASDRELIESTNDVNSPEFKTLDFLIRLIHRSNLNIALRPLETGRAKDVTGTLTISRGPIPYESKPISEKEYLYFVSKDQTTKLFFR